MLPFQNTYLNASPDLEQSPRLDPAADVDPLEGPSWLYNSSILENPSPKTLSDKGSIKKLRKSLGSNISADSLPIVRRGSRRSVVPKNGVQDSEAVLFLEPVSPLLCKRYSIRKNTSTGTPKKKSKDSTPQEIDANGSMEDSMINAEKSSNLTDMDASGPSIADTTASPMRLVSTAVSPISTPNAVAGTSTADEAGSPLSAANEAVTLHPSANGAVSLNSTASVAESSTVNALHSPSVMLERFEKLEKLDSRRGRSKSKTSTASLESFQIFNCDDAEQLPETAEVVDTSDEAHLGEELPCIEPVTTEPPSNNRAKRASKKLVENKPLKNDNAGKRSSRSNRNRAENGSFDEPNAERAKKSGGKKRAEVESSEDVASKPKRSGRNGVEKDLSDDVEKLDGTDSNGAASDTTRKSKQTLGNKSVDDKRPKRGGRKQAKPSDDDSNQCNDQNKTKTTSVSVGESNQQERVDISEKEGVSAGQSVDKPVRGKKSQATESAKNPIKKKGRKMLEQELADVGDGKFKDGKRLSESESHDGRNGKTARRSDKKMADDELTHDDSREGREKCDSSETQSCNDLSNGHSLESESNDGRRREKSKRGNKNEIQKAAASDSNHHDKLTADVPTKSDKMLTENESSGNSDCSDRPKRVIKKDTHVESDDVELAQSCSESNNIEGADVTLLMNETMDLTVTFPKPEKDKSESSTFKRPRPVRNNAKSAFNSNVAKSPSRSRRSAAKANSQQNIFDLSAMDKTNFNIQPYQSCKSATWQEIADALPDTCTAACSSKRLSIVLVDIAAKDNLVDIAAKDNLVDIAAKDNLVDITAKDILDSHEKSLTPSKVKSSPNGRAKEEDGPNGEMEDVDALDGGNPTPNSMNLKMANERTKSPLSIQTNAQEGKKRSARLRATDVPLQTSSARNEGSKKVRKSVTIHTSKAEENGQSNDEFSLLINQLKANADNGKHKEAATHQHKENDAVDVPLATNEEVKSHRTKRKQQHSDTNGKDWQEEPTPDKKFKSEEGLEDVNSKPKRKSLRKSRSIETCNVGLQSPKQTPKALDSCEPEADEEGETSQESAETLSKETESSSIVGDLEEPVAKRAVRKKRSYLSDLPEETRKGKKMRVSRSSNASKKTALVSKNEPNVDEKADEGPKYNDSIGNSTENIDSSLLSLASACDSLLSDASDDVIDLSCGIQQSNSTFSEEIESNSNSSTKRGSPGLCGPTALQKSNCWDPSRAADNSGPNDLEVIFDSSFECEKNINLPAKSSADVASLCDDLEDDDLPDVTLDRSENLQNGLHPSALCPTEDPLKVQACDEQSLLCQSDKASRVLESLLEIEALEHDPQESHCEEKNEEAVVIDDGISEIGDKPPQTDDAEEDASGKNVGVAEDAGDVITVLDGAICALASDASSKKKSLAVREGDSVSQYGGQKSSEEEVLDVPQATESQAKKVKNGKGEVVASSHPRRAATKVSSYNEPSLRRKLRQGDALSSTIYSSSSRKPSKRGKAVRTDNAS